MRTLLREMVDLLAPTRLPDPPYRTYLASSYDRRSRSPADAESWFANEDWVSAARPNEERVEARDGRREHVLLDVEGPGAVVRLWTATPAGTLRIYLDGASVPVVEEPLEGLLSGRGLLPEPFSYVAARGYNAYFPFPFRKHCKITIDQIVAKDPFQGGAMEKFYYQINYRIYPASVAPRVRTYQSADLQRAAPEIDQAGAILQHPFTAYGPGREASRVPLVREGDTLGASVTMDGGGAIREILLLRGSGTDDQALARARVSLEFDGEVTAEAPLSDWFGTAPDLPAYDSLPLSIGRDGTLICRWAMPFRERAVLKIQGAEGLEGVVAAERRPFDEDRSLYFHARSLPPEPIKSRPPRDLNLLHVVGRGLLVGSAFGLENPEGAKWWGKVTRRST